MNRINSIIQITIFTPEQILPNPDTEINLVKDSVFLNLFRKKKRVGKLSREDISEDVLQTSNISEEAPENGPEKSTEPPSNENMLDLIKDFNLYAIILAYCAWELRRNTHQGWLAAGWPLWVASEAGVRRTTSCQN